MRLLRRRRPTGNEWVPTETIKPDFVLGPEQVVVLRLGPGRGLLDYPFDMRCDAVANVWPTAGGWAEAPWPFDERYGWFVAPIDLRRGHVLAFRTEEPWVGCLVLRASDGALLLAATRR